MMRRRSATRTAQRPLACAQEPLEERVDKAGKRALARRNAKRLAKANALARAAEPKAKPAPPAPRGRGMQP